MVRWTGSLESHFIWASCYRSTIGMMYRSAGMGMTVPPHVLIFGMPLFTYNGLTLFGIAYMHIPLDSAADVYELYHIQSVILPSQDKVQTLYNGGTARGWSGWISGWRRKRFTNILLRHKFQPLILSQQRKVKYCPESGLRDSYTILFCNIKVMHV